MKILIIEDDEGMGKVLRSRIAEQLLERFPHARLVLARSMREGMQEVFTLPHPDVTFLDLGLGDSDWQQTLSRVEEIETKTSVIIITGHPEARIRELLQVPEVEIIQKTPDMWGRLIEAIARAMQRGRDRQFAEIDRKIHRLREMIDHAPPQ